MRSRATGDVGRDGLDACVYKGTTAPVNKAPPPVAKKPRPVPGEEFESAKPLPPLENPISEAPQNVPAPAAPAPMNQTETTPPPEQPSNSI